MKVITVEGE